MTTTSSAASNGVADSIGSSKPSAQRLPLLSCFTGGGFLDLGFELQGFEAVWRNEVDESFAEGFANGFEPIFGRARAEIHSLDSIEKVPARRILKSAFGGVAPTRFGMIGGPPCPDFSVGGKNRGGAGDRGSLTRTYAERIEGVRPTFFLLENVPGLLRTRKHLAFFESEVLKRLHGMYHLTYRVLNALDFGVPQDRERVILLGFLRTAFPHIRSSDPGRDVWFPWEARRKFAHAKNAFHWPETDPFGGRPAKPADVPLELTCQPYIMNTRETELLPNGLEGFKPYSSRFIEVAEGDVSRKSFKRLHRWRYSPTAAYGNNEVHLHPSEARRITVREALRIQTAPDDYALPPEMPLSHKFKLIGNGVPVRFAEAIAATIFDYVQQAG